MAKKQTIGQRIVSELISWIVPIVVGVLLFIVIQTYVAQSFEVSGPSMEPTLYTGDRMFMLKIGEPQRFDIVVVQAPDNALDAHGNRKEYVKRLIGMPGDHIAYRDNVLYINGVATPEPFLKTALDQANAQGVIYTEDYDLEQQTGYQKIPEGYYFILGDNRLNSKDSTEFGLVPRELIDGTASLRYWPLNRFGVVNGKTQ